MSVKASSVAKNDRVSVDFIGLGKDNVTESCGFYFDDGRISCMPSYKKHDANLRLSNCIGMVYNSYANKIMFYLKDGTVKLWDEVNNVTSDLAGLKSFPQYYVDCYYDDNHYPALVCGDKLHIFNEDGTIETKEYLCSAYACVYHYGRMFDVSDTERYEIFWTEPGMKTYNAAVDKAGFMSMPYGAGKITRLLDFDDRIIIMREYGINVLNGRADTRNFILAPNTVMLSDKPIENTIVRINKKVWFLTKSYLYCFDGNTLTQKEHPYNSNYYSFLRIDAIDERYLYISATYKLKPFIARYDTQTGEFIKAANLCKFICRTPRGLFTLNTSGYVGKLLKEGDEEDVMTFRKVDFGDGKYKTLKKLVFDADDGVTLNLTLDKKFTRSFETCENDGLSITARRFDFSLSGNGEVKELKAVWEVYK